MEMNNVLLCDFSIDKYGSFSTKLICAWAFSYWDPLNCKDSTVHVLPVTNLKTQKTK